ncbi:MAG: helix-turn-helix domain-containing protein [Planctomycetes bacterium]|nr:helix-turn-helix domain-containing protein [Planctomycetota bacterium]
MVDYFSFEDVMKELALSEEDLKRMVSEGELRAFRDENKMKFKKEDVDNLKKARVTEPTIILPSTPGSQQDETVLDLDISRETAQLNAETSEAKPVKAEPPAAKAPPDAAETDTDDLLVQPVGEDKPVAEIEETFVEEESDTGLTTEPLRLADEVETAETVESDVVTEEVVESAPARKRRTGRRTGSLPLAAEEEIERRRTHPVWTALTIAALVLAVYGGFFSYDLMMIENGRQDQPSGLTAGLGRWTLDQFWGDSNWRRFHEQEFPGGVPTSDSASDASWYTGPSFDKPDRPASADRP